MTDSSLSDAIKEAYASAPSGLVTLVTLEFRHPNFVDESGNPASIRVVNDHANLTATLEADAPLNPGESVIFISFNFDFQLPNVESVATPEMVLVLDNVTREIEDNLALATASPYEIQVTCRLYLSNDLTGPQNNPPYTFNITTCEADDFRVTCRCSMGNVANRQFPSKDYTVQLFPGLNR